MSVDWPGVSGPIVVEGEKQTLFLAGDDTEYDGDGNVVSPDARAGCVESTGVGDGTCYFVDSTHSNNWRQLRIINATHDMNCELTPNTNLHDRNILHNIASDPDPISLGRVEGILLRVTARHRFLCPIQRSAQALQALMSVRCFRRRGVRSPLVLQ